MKQNLSTPHSLHSGRLYLLEPGNPRAKVLGSESSPTGLTFASVVPRKAILEEHEVRSVILKIHTHAPHF